MEHINETLIQLIGKEVCEKELSLPIQPPFSDTFLIELFNVSKAHDVTHIAGSALIDNGFSANSLIFEQYRNCIYSTFYRYENQIFVLEKVSEVLEKNKIPYIPLKGAVIRELYPQPWMRTGCDIDILVSAKDAENAANAITEELDYKQSGRGKHDIQILSAENIYVELHFSLLEEDASPAIAKVLGKAWEYAKPAKNGSFRYELDDAMFYFYHIAHMAKHFIGGGCGLRPFLDLWLMDKNKNYDTAETRALLKKAKLTAFAKAARRLSRVWFSDEEHDETTKLMENFIFSGGSFGSKETRMLSAQQKSGGRKKYILSRIFVPYDDLKGQYPVIKKYRFLTPICEICRLFSLLFGKKKNFRKAYLGNLNNVSDVQINEIKVLFERVGLS